MKLVRLLNWPVEFCLRLLVGSCVFWLLLATEVIMDGLMRHPPPRLLRWHRSLENSLDELTNPWHL